jgi:flagellin-like protein
MKARRGISPVIATVIIVAVAIAISIAVAGWLMGLWGGFGQTESLKPFPDSYVDTQKNNLVLVIQNVGGSPAQIYKIEISGQQLDLKQAKATGNGITVDTQNGKITIQPGAKGTITIPLPQNFNAAAGVAYTVSIYTESGNVYTTTVYGQ